ncbi:MAG: hypothetical protein QOJ29_2406 [Thermoleophilaceae bacterium]|nr:hypothetical protein [Thermoleophilaceae bacterium]
MECRNPAKRGVFEPTMATNVRPVSASQTTRSAWRRAVNIAVVVALVVASVAAQAVDLTPVAILLLLGAVCALAPLFSPSLDV